MSRLSRSPFGPARRESTKTPGRCHDDNNLLDYFTKNVTNYDTAAH